MIHPDEQNAAVETIGHQDNSATSEYRIFGPPGTGKTTNLTHQIRRAVAQHGPDSVLVTSFSRAAATELAGQELPISRDRIGTLHSHCYHALGAPTIAESRVEEWNSKNPCLTLTPACGKRKLDGEDAAADDGDEPVGQGDDLLRQLNCLRGRMVDENSWPLAVRRFATEWTQYKRRLSLLDFTDLIERCLYDFAVAPMRPAVIFADEAQDLNRMQLSLIRRWGRQANHFILAGDDDQCIFSFNGASPDTLINPDIPDDHKIILRQSYRIPQTVHTLADKLIRRLTKREAKTYLARPEEGVVRRLSTGTYKSPEYFILKSAEGHLREGKSLMFLTSCSYMLRPLVATLRRRGMPFHNPYRKSNGFWNPLRIGSKGSSANTILALLVAHPDFGEGHHPWTYGDLVSWADCLTSHGILKRGMKEKLGQYRQLETLGFEQLEQVFEPGALASLKEAWKGDCRALLSWWRHLLPAGVRERFQFPVDAAAKFGSCALMDPPRIIVGTIHSVKGGQADVVYLFPDISRGADAHYQRYGEPRDSVTRVFYVGVTRTRETLYMCQRETAMAFAI